jgi:hypothetical protein
MKIKLLLVTFQHEVNHLECWTYYVLVVTNDPGVDDLQYVRRLNYPLRQILPITRFHVHGLFGLGFARELSISSPELLISSSELSTSSPEFWTCSYLEISTSSPEISTSSPEVSWSYLEIWTSSVCVAINNVQ